MNKLLRFTTFFFTIMSCTYAQPGNVDPTFNTNDPGFGNGYGYLNPTYSLACQPDGKVIVGGGASSYNLASIAYISRINTDGSMDNSFGLGTSGFNADVFNISLQNDGKIICGGSFFTSYAGTSRNKIARLNTDGTLDLSFDPGTGFNSAVISTAVQTDNKIVVGGSFTTYNGTSRSRIIRLNTDGTIDPAFTVGAGFNGNANCILVQPDGKLIIAGTFTGYNGTTANRIIRLNPDGTVDTGFTFGSGFNADVISGTLQPDGKIILGGNFTTYNGTGRNRILRLNADGSIDTSFDPGTGFNSSVNTIALQADGRIAIGGAFTTYNGISRNRIVQVNPDGTLDLSFNPGTGFNTTVNQIIVQADGEIVAAGSFTFYNNISRNRLLRINTDGSIDHIYNDVTGANLLVNTTLIQPDGKILICGDFTCFNDVYRNKIARLNIDGTVDTTFNPGTGFVLPAIASYRWSMLLQPDGKIIVAGAFSSYNGTARNCIVRLNSDGTLDPGFIIGTGFNSFVYGLALQPDGKILAGGNFTTYNGTSRTRIIRLNSNGTNDATFNPGAGFNSDVCAIAVQPDGKLIVGGSFSMFGAVSRNCLARLNANGSNDTGFNPAPGFLGYWETLLLQPDGKILAGGHTFGGTQDNLTRFNNDGTLDATFNTGAGFDGDVLDIALQPDGRIFAGGNFSNFNGNFNSCLVRLNANGGQDFTFSTGTGFDEHLYYWVVNSISIQADSKLIIGGKYSSYNGAGKNNLLRIFTTPEDCTSAPASPTAVMGPLTVCPGSINTYSVLPVNGADYYTWTLPGGWTDTSTTNMITTTAGTSGGSITVAAVNACGTSQPQAISVNVSGEVFQTQIFSVCSGNSITVGSNTYSSSGSYSDLFPAYNGCDSTITTILTVLPENTVLQTVTLCSGDSINVGSVIHSSDGIYSDVLNAFNGCDSTVITNLTILSTNTFNQNITLCNGQSIVIGTTTHSSSGNYTDTLSGFNSCDSIVTTNLIMLPFNSYSQNITLCNGQSLTIGTNTHTSSGTYTDLLTDSNGCDSTITTNLIINPPVEITTSVSDLTLISNAVSASYQWLDCSDYSAIQGENNISYTAGYNGNFAVEVTENGCTDTSLCITIASVGIADQASEETVIYPNPFSEQLLITGKKPEKIVIYNSIGQKIAEYDNPSNSEIIIKTHSFSNGVFFIQMYAKDKITIKKIIKE